MIPYDKIELFEKAKEYASLPDVYFIEDIISFMPCSKTTFYDNFPADSDELNIIKGILDVQKTKKKIELRNILSRSDKAAEVLALYKLIGTDEERKKLSQGFVDISTKDEKIQSTILTSEQISKLIDKI